MVTGPNGCGKSNVVDAIKWVMGEQSPSRLRGKAMDNVTLTLELPPNAELAPFPGRQTISWTVDLKQGDNVLALPINVLFPGSGKLVAHLDDGTRRKTFSTAIPGNTEPSS